MNPTPGMRGFTLIEMLVVLLIMGLLVGMVGAIAQPDAKALLRVEAERLAQVMDLAAAESRLGGKSIAWSTAGQGYRFWRLGADSVWAEIIDEDVLRARALPPGVVIANLSVENRRTLEPLRVEFSAYGSTPSFSVEMSLGAARFTVLNSPLGDVRVQPEGGVANDKSSWR